MRRIDEHDEQRQDNRAEWAKSRVLITGISGFVGPRLAKALLAQGAKVFGFTVRRADGRIPKNLRDLELQEAVHLIEGNLTDISSLAHALDVSRAFNPTDGEAVSRCV